MHLVIKAKYSESKWRLVETLRNQVLNSDYNGIVLEFFSDICRIYIFYNDSETALNIVEHIRDYMRGPGINYGYIVWDPKHICDSGDMLGPIL